MYGHILRQERSGGFWMVRDEGRVLELGPANYALCGELVDSGGALPPERLARLRGNALLEDSGVIGTLSPRGLFDPETLKRCRHVSADVDLRTLPTDAVAAPKRIYFEITRGCNLACQTCFNNSHFNLPNELSGEEIIDVNRQAEELGVFEIRYTGGECTTVPRFADIVADAKRRSFYISIGTNGVYTDEQLEWLPTCGIDWFIISLDGDRSRNDWVRGKGTYDSVVRTLSVLRKYPKVRVRFNMVVAKHNFSTIREVAQVAEEYNVNGVNLIPLRPYGRSTKKMTREMFDQEGFYDFIREVNRLRKAFPSVTFSTTIDLMDPDATTSHDLVVQKKTTCAAGVEACVVGPLGHVYGCSYSPASFPNSKDEEGKQIFIAGSMRQDSLKDIWRNSARWKVFRDLSQYKNPKCHSCGHYTVRCSGSCQIMAWNQLKHQERVTQGKAKIGDFFDPYCFVDLYEDKGKMADLNAPCGGAGMDGF